MTIHYYLAIDGVKGGSVDITGWFNLNSLQFGAGVGINRLTNTVSDPSLSEVTVTLDGMTPDLLARLSTGTPITSARIEGIDDCPSSKILGQCGSRNNGGFGLPVG